MSDDLDLSDISDIARGGQKANDPGDIFGEAPKELTMAE